MANDDAERLKLVKEVVTQLMIVLNEERRTMGNLFLVVVEVMHILCQEHENHKRRLSEIQLVRLTWPALCGFSLPVLIKKRCEKQQ